VRGLTHLIRALTGFVFILSGWIKLNDPVGFSFKLEEYFGAGVLNLPSLSPFALELALFLVVLEVLLGVFLWLGSFKKFTLYSLLAMIVFFTFLTFYSAYFNKVTDCGCFGDAIKLTPWESFTKDIVLLVFVLWLWFKSAHIQPLFTEGMRLSLLTLSMLFCGFYAYYVLNHLPVFDFRPYHIGANIESSMQIPEDASEEIYQYSWEFELAGRKEWIKTDGSFPEHPGTFTGKVETVLLQEGYQPPIHDFTLMRDGVDYTADLLFAQKALLVTAYDLDKADQEGLRRMVELADLLQKQGYQVYGMTASSNETIANFYARFGVKFYWHLADQTTVKTIIRSNPGVLYLERATIIDKKHFKDL
jgi:uncharacterized membrane protein YphA (DoxX/SURF4 family)